jgi:signal transduction histidine kinase
MSGLTRTLSWRDWMVPALLGAGFRHERARRERLVVATATEAQVRAAQQGLALAREVHDVVSNNLSVVVVQAELAQLLMHSDPAGSRRAMERVQDSGRLALGETRRLLDSLRELDAGDLVRALTWTDVCDLVVRMRQAGLPVTLDAPQPAPALTPEVSATAYRIVQEALTNVLRHARQAPTTVNISQEAGTLIIDVRDLGGAARVGSGAASDLGGAGDGLSGIRERVTSCGGTLTVGPSDDGGYRIHAVLPAGAPR